MESIARIRATIVSKVLSNEKDVTASSCPTSVGFLFLGRRKDKKKLCSARSKPNLLDRSNEALGTKGG